MEVRLLSPALKEKRMNFLSLLSLIFVAAKITHYIDWSWWWCFSPILVQLSAIVFVVTIKELEKK